MPPKSEGPRSPQVMPPRLKIGAAPLPPTCSGKMNLAAGPRVTGERSQAAQVGGNVCARVRTLQTRTQRTSTPAERRPRCGRHLRPRTTARRSENRPPRDRPRRPQRAAREGGITRRAPPARVPAAPSPPVRAPPAAASPQGYAARQGPGEGAGRRRSRNIRRKARAGGRGNRGVGARTPVRPALARPPGPRTSLAPPPGAWRPITAPRT